MTEEALKNKESSLRGLKKQACELIECAWLKGYVAGAKEGYDIGRKAGPYMNEHGEEILHNERPNEEQ